MASNWWQLPGPSAYCEDAAQDLREGKNIILKLPENMPGGILDCMHRAFPTEEGGSWSKHVVQDGDRAPINQLYRSFVIDRKPSDIRNPASLAREEALSGRIIWLEGITTELWPEWKEFLENYAHACRSVDPIERLLFCVPLVGQIANTSPHEDVCLSHHKWLGCVDSLDTLLYTHSCFRKKNVPEPLKRLTIAMTASLAQWDPLIVDDISVLPIENIFDPFFVLQRIAEKRCWSSNDYNSPKWHKGQVNIVDGIKMIHPALLSVSNKIEAVQQKIWAAQVGIMLPFVETCRQRLLQILPIALKVPYKTRFGEVITSRKGLEIGHIESQIYRNGNYVPPELKYMVPKLREIRNRLAHMEPLSLDLVACKEIVLTASDLHDGKG